MTEQEKKELEDTFNISVYSTEYLAHETYTDLFKRKLIEFMEKKKKEWQEEAFFRGYEAVEKEFNAMFPKGIKELKSIKY